MHKKYNWCYDEWALKGISYDYVAITNVIIDQYRHIQNKDLLAHENFTHSRYERGFSQSTIISMVSCKIHNISWNMNHKIANEKLKR